MAVQVKLNSGAWSGTALLNVEQNLSDFSAARADPAHGPFFDGLLGLAFLARGC
jgi:hypothetical protein